MDRIALYNIILLFLTIIRTFKYICLHFLNFCAHYRNVWFDLEFPFHWDYITLQESNSHCLNNKCVGSMFPKLEVLDIEGCPLLESIFPFLFVQDLPVLETIKIRRCHGLKFMFGQYQHVEFSSLRQLELCQLPNFIDMFRKSNHPISLYEKGSSSTSNYHSKAQLQLVDADIFSGDTTTTIIPLVDADYPVSLSPFYTIIP
jgi:hypothetical protein